MDGMLLKSGCISCYQLSVSLQLEPTQPHRGKGTHESECLNVLMTLLNRSWRSLYGLRSPNSLVTFVTVRNVARSNSMISSAFVSLAKSCKYPSMMCKFETKDFTMSPHALYKL